MLVFFFFNFCVNRGEIVSELIIFRIHSDKKEKHNEFHIEGKHAKILGWGGTIDKENATTQDRKVQCDLLEAFTTVKQCTASTSIQDNKSGGPPAPTFS